VEEQKSRQTKAHYGLKYLEIDELMARISLIRGEMIDFISLC